MDPAPGLGRVTPIPPALRGKGAAGIGLLLALALAGCGNNPYPPGESARPVLYRALSDDPKTLDPSVSYGVDEAPIIDVLYASYFQYHYLKRDPYVLELALGAEQPRREPYWYAASENGRAVRKRGESWTFRIKHGLRFQDDPCFPGGKGREIVAADFLYSFRRMADPRVSCPVLSFFEDKILGFSQYTERNRERVKAGEGADYRAPVAGLRLDPGDPYTFRIVLNQPYPQLRYLMAMHFTTPLAREAVERYGAELARHPVGNGPYLLAEYKPKQRIVLKANPNRRAEFYPSEGAPGDREAGLLRDAGARLPLADTVVYNILREAVTGWNLFLQGYQDSWGVNQTNYQQVISQSGQPVVPGDDAQGRAAPSGGRRQRLVFRLQPARPGLRRLHRAKAQAPPGRFARRRLPGLHRPVPAGQRAQGGVPDPARHLRARAGLPQPVPPL